MKRSRRAMKAPPTFIFEETESRNARCCARCYGAISKNHQYPQLYELRNMITVTHLIVKCAEFRQENKGPSFQYRLSRKIRTGAEYCSVVITAFLFQHYNNSYAGIHFKGLPSTGYHAFNPSLKIQCHVLCDLRISLPSFPAAICGHFIFSVTWSIFSSIMFWVQRKKW
ncbi:MAG: hypothetical protein IPP96_07085 [Chitinophagaceae bacterium]|nr:hypothetical protein [Chitinophagaceae bacterium]